MLKHLSSLIAVATADWTLTGDAHASTAAFAGKVIEVADCPAKQSDCQKLFTVRFNYLDYISWSKYGSHTKAGETIRRRVMSRGTACVLNGRLTNAKTFSAAIRPDTWGYFYEDTWLDLYTLPDFTWGEVVTNSPAHKKFMIRVHQTHKQVHIDANPPELVEVSYDEGTAFRTEEQPASPKSALLPGTWVQIHDPRPQIISILT